MALETQHYIASGILEAYLLGLVADAEKEELERVLNSDPEVLAQLNELEATMEDYFLNNAVPPPPGIREKIELRISQTEIKKWEEISYTNPKPKSENSQSTQSPYIDVEINNTYIQVHKNWRTAFISVFILSKVFLILGLYYYFKSSSLEQEINRLKSATQQTMPHGRTE